VLVFALLSAKLLPETVIRAVDDAGEVANIVDKFEIVLNVDFAAVDVTKAVEDVANAVEDVVKVVEDVANTVEDVAKVVEDVAKVVENVEVCHLFV
jgi:methyl-accepting chemotaxis protein